MRKKGMWMWRGKRAILRWREWWIDVVMEGIRKGVRVMRASCRHNYAYISASVSGLRRRLWLVMMMEEMI